MDLDSLPLESRKALDEIVGYLNFSSGATDPRFLANVNALFGSLEYPEAKDSTGQVAAPGVEPTWRVLGRRIEAALARLRRTSQAFRQVDQAEAVVRLVFDRLLPAYRRHHRDLLFHQTEEPLFQPFFIGRVCEAVLSEAGPWQESDRIVPGALKRLNDFIGYRPVAVLQTEQKLQPYAHEWVRPIPLYVAGAGVAVGRYHDLIETTLAILRTTDRALLDRASFDPELLEELALDPRAYDFDHPVHRRLAHQFGGWDPHHIDNRGRYRRFVLHQVTLDGLLSRLDEHADLPRAELRFEAASVLAGTILMAAGVSGGGPGWHDSSTTLNTLQPIIAGYRDAFYEQLLDRLPAEHARRLHTEAGALRQPFGGARQHLNQTISHRRAEQLQHVQLARLFARMGYTEAAARQARVVPVASARMQCEIDCRLTTAQREIEQGRLDAAASLLSEIEDLLHRAIECGALVDPWNILGFGGQFSLFPAPENSIRDHRIDELIDLVSEVFALYARLEQEAAAAEQTGLEARLSDQLGRLAGWWDQFASSEVGGVEGVSGRQAWESATQVAAAIAAWHEAGTGAGDIAFWRKHVERFRSPEAFALLAETLIDRRDLVASMALLMVWLGQAEQIPLAEGSHSFHTLAVRWMEELWGEGSEAEVNDRLPRGRPDRPEQPWPLAGKFFDYLEANAEEYWHVPRLELLGPSTRNGSEDDDQPEEASSDDLFAAAYEDVTYRDTTDDGFEGEMLEGGDAATDFELSLEAERISGRLMFLITLARLWKLAAAASARLSPENDDRDPTLAEWRLRAQQYYRQLLDLLWSVHRYRLPPPGLSRDAMVESDRRRAIKEVLLERIVAACEEMADASRLVTLTMSRGEPAPELEAWELRALRVMQAMFRGDRQSVRAAWPDLLEALRSQPLLYVPVSRGGNPQRVVASRGLQQWLDRLLDDAPRLGLLAETYRLLQTIQAMEQDHPAGPGAITEFDRLFEIGCQGILQCLVVSAGGGPAAAPEGQPPNRWSDFQLVECLESATESLLGCWLAHSRKVRLSVLETVADKDRWAKLKRFIRTYGRDLFTQTFMNPGNLRAVLEQGAEAYFAALEEEAEAEPPPKLLDDLDRRIPRQQAARWLELSIEAVVENYAEYADYNSTTTQSDRGEMLYTLLDFLRLQASYERLAWNLRPVLLAHEVLVRHGRGRAAKIWEEAVRERTRNAADGHLRRLEKLSQQYGMRLRSIADRLGERFVRPLSIDRLCALVRPAVEELRQRRRPEAFKRLEEEIGLLAEQPGGAGLDIPSWLEALESEVEHVRFGASAEDEPEASFLHVPQVRLPLEEIQRQIEMWRQEEEEREEEEEEEAEEEDEEEQAGD